MPAAGTKKMVLQGEVQYRPEEEVEFAEVIALGLAATEDFEVAKRRLEEVRERFIALVEPKREGRASVKIEGLRGGIGSCTWSNDKVLDHDALVALRQRMEREGEGTLFGEIFEAKETFSYKRAAAKVIRSSGRVSPYLREIASAISVKPKHPSVKFTPDAGDTLTDEEVDGG